MKNAWWYHIYLRDRVTTVSDWLKQCVGKTYQQHERWTSSRECEETACVSDCVKIKSSWTHWSRSLLWSYTIRDVIVVPNITNSFENIFQKVMVAKMINLVDFEPRYMLVACQTTSYCLSAGSGKDSAWGFSFLEEVARGAELEAVPSSSNPGGMRAVPASMPGGA